jgi:hypothetical protein
VRGEGVRGEGGASARTHHVHADACARSRVNADAGGRPDEKVVQTDIFIQKRPL